MLCLQNAITFYSLASFINDMWDFPGGSDGKESVCNVGDPGLSPELERSPGQENGKPFQYSCLDNSMGGGARGYHRVSNTQTIFFINDVCHSPIWVW